MPNLQSHRLARLAGCAALLLALSACQEPETPPPVVLISLDTLRAENLSVYGYERNTSPRLEEFAREAVVFERAYHSGGGTLPSHMSLMTGLTPVAHGIRASHDAGNVLHLARETLAERLRGAGYWTAAFTDRGWLRSKFGIHQGFDVFDEEGGRFAKILPKAKRWLDRNQERPIFLFVHSYDVHSQSEKLPYECPEPWVGTFTEGMAVDFDGCRDGLCASKLLLDLDRRLVAGELTPDEALSADELEYLVALYDGCIRYVDDRVADLFAHLRELGLYDESLIVVLSDHGEEFLDHGRLVHQQGGYEELSRMPLLVKLPGGEFGGQRISELVAMVDVLPTVLDVVGVEPPPGAQGRSLMPLIASGEAVRQEVHMLDVYTDGRWKLLRGTQELYDMEADPEETKNLWRERQDVVQRLLRDLGDLLAADRAERDHFEASLAVRKNDVSLSPEEIEELKALGYLSGVD